MNGSDTESIYIRNARVNIKDIQNIKIPKLNLDEQKEILKAIKKYDDENKGLEKQILKNKELKKEILEKLKD